MPNDRHTTQDQEKRPQEKTPRKQEQTTTMPRAGRVKTAKGKQGGMGKQQTNAPRPGGH